LFHNELEQLGAKLHLGSITDPELVDRLVRDQDVVHHLAAAFRRLNMPKAAYWETNVNGTRNLLDAAFRFGVKKFVHCSTGGVHGEISDPPASESAPITPADYYQRSKWEGEKVAHEYMDKGLDITILRPGAIYGPGDPARWAMLFKHIAKGRFFMLGSGDTTYHPVYIDNLVDAFTLAQEKPESKYKTYLIADEQYYTIKDIVKIIARTLGVDVKIVHLPFWPVWLAAVGNEAVAALLNKEPMLFRRRLEWFKLNRAFSISKAKQEMGYQPKVDLPTGLMRTAEWLRTMRLI
jgi:nucleoside-diphosphate-sugar epimerase